jgi:hypothetical protein
VGWVRHVSRERLNFEFQCVVRKRVQWRQFRAIFQRWRVICWQANNFRKFESVKVARARSQTLRAWLLASREGFKKRAWALQRIGGGGRVASLRRTVSSWTRFASRRRQRRRIIATMLRLTRVHFLSRWRSAARAFRRLRLRLRAREIKRRGQGLRRVLNLWRRAAARSVKACGRWALRVRSSKARGFRRWVASLRFARLTRRALSSRARRSTAAAFVTWARTAARLRRARRRVLRRSFEIWSRAGEKAKRSEVCAASIAKALEFCTPPLSGVLEAWARWFARVRLHRRLRAARCRRTFNATCAALYFWRVGSLKARRGRQLAIRIKICVLRSGFASLLRHAAKFGAALRRRNTQRAARSSVRLTLRRGLKIWAAVTARNAALDGALRQVRTRAERIRRGVSFFLWQAVTDDAAVERNLNLNGMGGFDREEAEGGSCFASLRLFAGRLVADRSAASAQMDALAAKYAEASQDITEARCLLASTREERDELMSQLVEYELLLRQSEESRAATELNARGALGSNGWLEFRKWQADRGAVATLTCSQCDLFVRGEVEARRSCVGCRFRAALQAEGRATDATIQIQICDGAMRSLRAALADVVATFRNVVLWLEAADDGVSGAVKALCGEEARLIAAFEGGGVISSVEPILVLISKFVTALRHVGGRGGVLLPNGAAAALVRAVADARGAVSAWVRGGRCDDPSGAFAALEEWVGRFLPLEFKFGETASSPLRAHPVLVLA